MRAFPVDPPDLFRSAKVETCRRIVHQTMMADTEAVIAVIGNMVRSINEGDMPAALAAFSDDAVIIEDIAPYRWLGPGAVGAWLTAMAANAQSLGVSAITMELGTATRVSLEEDRAYALFPGLLRLQAAQDEMVADGQLTFTLMNGGGGWRIESLVWSGPEPSLR